MKVGEARQLYNAQLKEYNVQKFQLAQQKKELEEKRKASPDGQERYAEEAASLELSYQAVSEKQQEYQDYMDQLMEQYRSRFDAVNCEQQADAAEEYGKEMGKILTIARRIMHGDIVPSTDEKKLMEFDDKLYQVAKNIGIMKQMEKRKKYESLWDDEKKEQAPDPASEADEQEAFAEGPEIVAVSDLMASVGSGDSSAGGETAS